jgi:heme/copper-type cytochrome/quinol oxidase subunit 3
VTPEHATDTRLDELPFDVERGTMGMLLAITTEAFLFVSMFFAYFYTGHQHKYWPSSPPKLTLALVMLAILVTSSVVLHQAERSLKKGAHGAARLWLVATIVAGAVFLVIQTLEYKKHLVELQPTTNAYGSLFYTITSFHGLHLAVGLVMLLYVAFLPDMGPAERPPHHALHNASLYWHFVDVVWVFIVGLLYLLPHWTR